MIPLGTLILLLINYDNIPPYLLNFSFSDVSDSSCLFYLCFLFILCLEIPFQASVENPSSDMPPLTLCIRLVSIVYILIAQCPFYFRTYHKFNKMIASTHNYVIEDQVSFCIFLITFLSLAKLLVITGMQ